MFNKNNLDVNSKQEFGSTGKQTPSTQSQYVRTGEMSPVFAKIFGMSTEDSNVDNNSNYSKKSVNNTSSNVEPVFNKPVSNLKFDNTMIDKYGNIDANNRSNSNNTTMYSKDFSKNNENNPLLELFNSLRNNKNKNEQVNDAEFTQKNKLENTNNVSSFTNNYNNTLNQDSNLNKTSNYSWLQSKNQNNVEKSTNSSFLSSNNMTQGLNSLAQNNFTQNNNNLADKNNYFEKNFANKANKPYGSDDNLQNQSMKAMLANNSSAIDNKANNKSNDIYAKVEAELKNQELLHKFNNLENKYTSISNQVQGFETLLSEIKDFKSQSLTRLDQALIIPASLKSEVKNLQENYADVAVVLKSLIDKFNDFSNSNNAVHNLEDTKFNMLNENILRLTYDLKSNTNDYAHIINFINTIENTLSKKIENLHINNNDEDYKNLLAEVNSNLNTLGGSIVSAFNDIKKNIEDSILHASTYSTSYLSKIILNLDQLMQNSVDKSTISELSQTFANLKGENLAEINSNLKNLEDKISYLNLTKDQQYNDTRELIAQLFNQMEEKLHEQASGSLDDILIQFKNLFTEVNNNNKELHNEKEDLYKAVIAKLNELNDSSATNKKVEVEELNGKINNLIDKQLNTISILENIKSNVDSLPSLSNNNVTDSAVVNNTILEKIANDINSISSHNSSIVKEQNSFTEKMYNDMQSIKKSIIDLIATQKSSAVDKGEQYINEAKTALKSNVVKSVSTDKPAPVATEIKKTAQAGSDIKSSNIQMAINKLKEALDLDDGHFGSIQLKKEHRTIDEILDKKMNNQPLEKDKKNIEKEAALSSVKSHNKEVIDADYNENKKKQGKDTFILDNSIFFNNK
ncbi:hypothetical protein ACFX5K_06025 [Rickettsiales bacterium LUAb2]